MAQQMYKQQADLATARARNRDGFGQSARKRRSFGQSARQFETQTRHLTHRGGTGAQTPGSGSLRKAQKRRVRVGPGPVRSRTLPIHTEFEN